MLLVKTIPLRAGITVFCSSGTPYRHKYACYPVARQAGRNYDQLQKANPHSYWSLVSSTLKYLKIDSLYVCTGKAVRYNRQTVRVWKLRVWAGKHGFY